MNFFAVIIILNANPGANVPTSELYIAGPLTEQSCTAKAEQAKTKLAGDPGISKVITSCITEEQLPKLADAAKAHDCTFVNRIPVDEGATLASFACDK